MKSFTSHSLQETRLGSLTSSNCCQHGSTADGLVDSPASFLTHCPPPASICFSSHCLCRPAQSTAILFVPAQLTTWLNAESERERYFPAKTTFLKPKCHAAKQAAAPAEQTGTRKKQAAVYTSLNSAAIKHPATELKIQLPLNETEPCPPETALHALADYLASGACFNT